MSSAEFLDFVLEQMSQLRGLRSNRMFGGFGIYQHEFFFALIADDRLYFKADVESRADFLARNLAPFTYPRRGVTASREKAGLETMRTNPASVSGQVAQPLARCRPNHLAARSC